MQGDRSSDILPSHMMMPNTTILKQYKLEILLNQTKTETSLVLTENNLSWQGKTEVTNEKVKPETVTGSGAERAPVEVRIPWILRVVVEDVSSTPVDSADEQAKIGTLTVHYAVRVPKPENTTDLTHTLVCFYGAPEDCKDIAKAIEEQISKKVPGRPRSLLVIVNPTSGNNKGEKIYREKIAPVFDLSGINADVIVSKRPKYAYELLDEYDLSKIDGLIAVGGDGTFTEVASALLKRTMKDAGVDDNDPNASLKTPAITCSLIAAGSANGHPLYSGFSKNPTSSALVVAIGQTQTQDVVTVHCGDKLIAYALLLLSYGQTARIFDSMEKNRWAGPARYLALPFGLFFNRRLIDVEIDYISADDSGSSHDDLMEQTGKKDDTAGRVEQPRDTAGRVEQSRDTAGKVEQPRDTAGRVEHPSEETADKATHVQPTPRGATANTGLEWKTISDRVLDTGSVVIDLRSRNYDKPYYVQQNLNNGVLYLMITKNCSRMKQIKFFSKLKKFDPTAFEVDFIDYLRVKAYRVRATGNYADSKSALAMNWDGDMLYIPEPHFETRNHQGLLRIFSRHDGEELRAADTTANPGNTVETAVNPGKTVETMVNTGKTAETMVDPGKTAETMVDPEKTAETMIDPGKTAETVVNPGKTVETAVNPRKTDESGDK